MNNQTSENPDHLLQAHLYLSGEMAAEEFTSFEQRLENSLPLQEALADAVQIQQAVAVCQPSRNVAPAVTPSRQHKQGWSQRLLAIATTVAALLLIAYSGFYTTTSPSTRDVATNPTEVRSSDISAITLWATLGEQTTSQHASQVVVDTSDSAPLLADSDELEVPDWMLFAVAGTRDEEMDLIDRDTDGETL